MMIFTPSIPVGSGDSSVTAIFPSANKGPEQSSQWDGLRHFSQTVPGQKERIFYGGMTAQEINDRTNDRLGIHHWAQEGIAGMRVHAILNSSVNHVLNPYSCVCQVVEC
jgi:hypothetical protein